MRFVLLTGLVVFSLSNLFGQQEIKEIRSHYYKVSKQIEKCSNPDVVDDCELYCSTFEINSNNKMWSAVGTYNKKVTFWYDNVNCDGCEGNVLKVLKKIEIDEKVAALKNHCEFLYNNGELIFAFYNLQTYEGAIEQRYYFKDNKVIKFLAQDESGDEKKDFNAIKKDIKTFENIFIQTH